MKLKIAVAFAIVYLVWGSTYLAIRIGLESMPPFAMAGFRFLVAGGLLWLWCEVRRIERATWSEARNAALVGLAMVAVGNGLVTWAEQSVPSGLAALIVAVGPVFTMLLGWQRGVHGRPNAATLIGLALGIGGVGLLVFGSSKGRVDPIGAAAIVLATLGWSWGALQSQGAKMPASPLRSNAIQMLAGGLAMLIVGLGRGEAARIQPASITMSSWLALGYLILFGSLAAYTAYQWLLRHVSATAAGTSAYVNPAVAVLLGRLWGEPIGANVVIAMALIFVGVYLLRRPPAEEPLEGG